MASIFPFPFPFLTCVYDPLCNAAVGECMTDEGLFVLADFGCGASLASLTLDGGTLLPLFFCVPSQSHVCGFSCCCVLFAGLDSSVSDEGLCALAESGCGISLTSLSLRGLCVLLCHVAFNMSQHLMFTSNFPALGSRVTDRGLRALAEAGCGANMTMLSLRGELFPFFSWHHHAFTPRPTHSTARGCDGRRAPCAGGGGVWSQPDVADSLV